MRKKHEPPTFVKKTWGPDKEKGHVISKAFTRWKNP